MLFEMIGARYMIAAALLPALVLARPNNHSTLSDSIASLKQAGYLKDGKLEIPVAKFCNHDLPNAVINDRLCAAVTKFAKHVHVMESTLFCSHTRCTAKYDPMTGLCQCNWGTAEQMDEKRAWPGKNCEETVRCYAPFEPHWNPITATCTCSIQTFSDLGSHTVQFMPNELKEQLYGPTKIQASEQIVDQMIQDLENEINRLGDWYKQGVKTLAQRGLFPSPNGFNLLKKLHRELTRLKMKVLLRKRRNIRSPRQEVTNAISPAPIPLFIPPPDTEITQELIQESLLIQPQRVATVGSVIPHFTDGMITFLVQLDGPISQTLALNATDTLPCENIGVDQQPHLVLVPKTVKNGTTKTVLPTCLVIAVNMYDPKYITYWVQKEDGSVFSLLSDNKIHAVDQLDTSQPASVVIQVAAPDDNAKRAVDSVTTSSVLKRRQIYSIACDKHCPFYHMERIHSSDGYCGCMFKDANQPIDLTKRGVEIPSPYTATMTAEACAAMTCINNGGKPALFNPFTATCWCTNPVYVEEHENAYNGM